jgi:iron complex transport system ATP-binding protein
MVVLDQVSFGFQTTPILRNISLMIEGGERFGVLGPNGAGKSTLLKVVNGILRPQRGRVLIDGRDVQTWRRLELARLIAVVPQEHQVVFPFTVEEIVLMGRTPYLHRWPFPTQLDRDVVECALDCTGTRELAGIPFLHLSSGEKQRVIIARAIAQRPKILLLDEFTAALDVRYQLDLHALIDRLCAEQKLAVMMVSHDLNLAVRHCDRLMLMEQGAVVAMGIPVEVLKPQNIQRVFGVKAWIDVHPVTERLYVIVERLDEARP